MPESMRLNQMVDCRFCEVQVNPFVVRQEGTLGPAKVECPNCGNEWEVKLERGSLPWESKYK